MKTIINKDNIIFLALIYNYIVNNKMSVSIDKALEYVNSVNNYLKNIESNIEISLDEENKGYLDMEKDEEAREYRITYLDDIGNWYAWQLNEILSASLQEDSLLIINVCKKDLQIEKNYIRKSGIMNIYSLEAARAKKIVKSYLEEDGAKEIKIGLAIPDQLDGDKGYHVSYECDMPCERVVLSKKNKY